MSRSRFSRRAFMGSLSAATASLSSRVFAAAPADSFRIELIELYVRMTPPGRLAVAIGKNSGPKPQPERNPIAHVRMVVRNAEGRRAFGCSGDRMSVRWLDKRPGRSKRQKLVTLVRLIGTARSVYLANPEFSDPFSKWLESYQQIHQAGRRANEEDLTSSFASALLERAMLDAVCRIANQPLFEMLKQDRLGLRPGRVLPELKGFALHEHLPQKPHTHIQVRHTVGKVDPLTSSDIATEDRLDDGLPQALSEYVSVNGLRMFKLKASGDVQFDLQRMQAIWKVLPHRPDTLITIDANEAYANLPLLEQFVDRLQTAQPDFMKQVAYIEQPLPRGLTLDQRTAPDIRRIGAKKRLIIDEADGTLTAFSQARRIGYSGCSHKNCKGFYKSLLNLSLIKHYAESGEQLILSGEDLQNMPIVPLHQDYAAVAALGLEHCERNGHHFNYGLSMVSPSEHELAKRFHQDMYRQQDGELFLDIQNGFVDTSSLQCAGFGVRFEPDWKSMQPMQQWVNALPAET